MRLRHSPLWRSVTGNMSPIPGCSGPRRPTAAGVGERPHLSTDCLLMVRSRFSRLERRSITEEMPRVSRRRSPRLPSYSDCFFRPAPACPLGGFRESQTCLFPHPRHSFRPCRAVAGRGRRSAAGCAPRSTRVVVGVGARYGYPIYAPYFYDPFWWGFYDYQFRRYPPYPPYGTAGITTGRRIFGSR